jgi:hypothetical protein
MNRWDWLCSEFTWFIAQDDFIIFNHREIFMSYRETPIGTIYFGPVQRVSLAHGHNVACDWYIYVRKTQCVLKVALPKYLVLIIRRYRMCIEHAGQQFEQLL